MHRILPPFAALAALSLWMSPASAQDTAPRVQDIANHCLAADSNVRRGRSSAGFRNSCDFAVTFQYCLTLRRGGDDAACPNSETREVAANGFTAVPALRRAERIYVLACNQAHQLTDVRWNGAGLEGQCRG